MTTAVSHESAAMTNTNFRPEINYRALHLATQDALYAIERGQLRDFWPAYERMHEAAAMGPMDWTGKPHAGAFAVSGNPASLVAGNLDSAALARIVAGVARNVESEDRFGVWTLADHAVHGARRIHLYGLKRSIALMSDRIDKLTRDLSSQGLQSKAEFQSDLAVLTRDLAAELIVAGLADDVAVLS